MYGKQRQLNIILTMIFVTLAKMTPVIVKQKTLRDIDKGLTYLNDTL